MSSVILTHSVEGNLAHRFDRTDPMMHEIEIYRDTQQLDFRGWTSEMCTSKYVEEAKEGYLGRSTLEGRKFDDVRTRATCHLLGNVQFSQVAFTTRQGSFLILIYHI